MVSYTTDPVIAYYGMIVGPVRAQTPLVS